MECLVLGCDGAYPSANGACSSYLLTDQEGTSILMDLGSGALGRLMAVMDPAALDGVFVTHWHADHASDLLVLRYYLLVMQRRLTLYAPSVPDPLRSLCEEPEFDLRDLAPGFSVGGLVIETVPTRHPVPCLALRVTVGNRSLVYTGDTNTSAALTSFCQGADLLLCDAAYTDAQWDESLPHLSASKAAQMALDAGVKRLVLTHCPPHNDPHTLLQEARAVFPDSSIAFAGLRLSL